MEDEQLNIFDSKGKFTGTASRADAHKKGLWHETFHCWFISNEEDRVFIHFQLRSPYKKDFASMLDITAAGHLNSDEDVKDGVREIKEELGISLTLNDLIYTGTVPDEIVIDDFNDRELCHVFIYKIPENTEPDYVFMDDEVADIVKIELSAFEKLWSEKTYSINIDSKSINRNSFVPHENRYIDTVIKSIKQFALQYF
ncbi:putative Nudix hydrolase [Jeotgalicoccus coquinae]|uniref:Isopentenyl-diphosphate Delta-isomerase n=1 Tax=Jeotgalicoccus coquinae TaxID=709509 RepID=A0A6V7R2K7_9STAP|nr:NUDIX domain-containing protein [Jeotgalicoccus coquinae]MBB6423617.1 isopentenyldiphosphate isomerase [Jeotgalicoccus coquinae]GGE21258.1 putative Nudix hydrolase [Jeotgalicoccus coquinae]CAD2071294.1 Isopentenyl-diphosphate Delta-isomerase [Jeotgalicoccus coquinae]